MLILISAPFIAALLAFASSTFIKRDIKKVAVLLSLIPLFVLLSKGFSNWIGDEIRLPWLSFLSIEFYLKIDSLSLVFMYLTAIIIPLSIIVSRKEKQYYPNTFYGFVLLLQGLLTGFFTARDLVVFLVFWEAMLIPIFFIITLWGKSLRHQAALKFLIYMIAGSSLMVAAVLLLYFSAGTFNLDTLAATAQNSPWAKWAFAIFVLAFAVKTPLFPFHAWLPDTYYQASTSGTILLSALLSKAGIFGFLRIGLGLFPDLMREWSPLLLGLAIVGVLYGGMAAWMQNDYKRLLAYSSFSHVNFVLAGIYILSNVAHEGAILQAFNHGITIAGLFLVAGWLEERIGSTSMSPFSGLATYFPQLCWLTMVFVLSSIALPGTNNFIGELLILYGLFGQHPWLTLILGLSIILSVVYMLRWMQKVYFETPQDRSAVFSTDIKRRELLIALPLAALIFWVGIYPDPFLKQIAPAFGNQDVSPRIPIALTSPKVDELFTFEMEGN